MAELVAMQLRREHFDTEVVHDGAAALDRIRTRPPDLVLLDLMLPGLPGLEILRRLRADPRTSTVPVIVLTARSEEGDVVSGLHMGADDYITKPFNLSVLSARVAAVLRRSESTGPDADVLTAGPIRLNRQIHSVEVDGEPVSLTLTEFRLLAAILAGRGRVLTRDQLIDKAMGQNAVVTDRTIDVHVTALRRKLGDARKYVQTVRGLGYKLAGQDDENT